MLLLGFDLIINILGLFTSTMTILLVKNIVKIDPKSILLELLLFISLFLYYFLCLIHDIIALYASIVGHSSTLFIFSPRYLVLMYIETILLLMAYSFWVFTLLYKKDTKYRIFSFFFVTLLLDISIISLFCISIFLIGYLSRNKRAIFTTSTLFMGQLFILYFYQIFLVSIFALVLKFFGTILIATSIPRCVS